MPSISEAFKTHPINQNPRPYVDLGGMHEVPDSHAWPDLRYRLGGDGGDDSPVPVIDLTEPGVAGRLGHACETWGMFQLINHGVPMRTLDDVEQQGRRLFALPAEQKTKAARAPDGVTGYGMARISSFFSKQLWSEGFTIIGSSEAHARLLWPEAFSDFCEVMEEYGAAMQKLAERLLWLLLESLGISKAEVPWAEASGEIQGSASALQLNWYPACPNPEKAMGLGEHTDSPLLTILYQSSISGLQVLNGDGRKWVTVPPVPGALVVNVGDLLHVLSNGRFKSILHRAVVNRTRPRLSAAYFWGPPNHVRLSPFAKLVGPESPAMYPPMSWPEYLKIKGRHFNDSLSVIRLRHPAAAADDR